MDLFGCPVLFLFVYSVVVLFGTNQKDSIDCKYVG